ncbi:TraB/GumN family protein [Aureibacter tunicatorum]|uniref:TraB/GumN family protein n=1 Tax=Aureibacter tunicatorum TaxID=866807 RepID=A0AAE4BU53_9BACT|nr:TraB/GumN family protein [Aureibacter tunicatorum]MDR6241436.1 hypothetical protein [Aureibacter tunicatorum]BDD06719.1 hypothetical protein AUTU_42020 [Aureibacter tunicatorum]
MKKALLCLTALFLISFGTQGQSIWKVEKNGNTMYLGGTIHVLRAEDHPLPEAYDKAFDASDKVAFEADLDKVNDPSFAQLIMSRSVYTDDRTLQSVLKEDTYNDLANMLEKYQLPASQLQKLKPSMILLMVMVLEMQKNGIGTEGVDKFYHDKAKNQDKPIAYMESVEDQISIITNMGEGNEDKYVKYSLRDMENMIADLEEMLSEWRKGSTKYFNKQIKEMKSDYPDIYQQIQVDRNKLWLPKIEKMMQDGSTEFVMVGTMHLHGKEGLLKMLSKKGYKVSKFD